MPKTKTLTEPQPKAAPSPALTHEPALPEKQSGPAMAGPLQRAAGGLPPPDGTLPASRAASMLAVPHMGGPTHRTRALRTLQRTVGNARVGRMLGMTVQTKLMVNAPNDIYEQEADRVADQVMRMPEPRIQRQVEPEEEETLQTKPLTAQITSLVQRQVEAEEEEEEEPVHAKLTEGTQLQRQEEMEEEKEPLSLASVRVRRQRDATTEPLQAQATPGEAPEITPDVESHISASRRGGERLTESERAFAEPRFGQDFGGVRVHTDGQSNQVARALNAQAFTTGQDIYFGAGHYQPGTKAGNRLLAHELTHVVQQQGTNAQANVLNQKNVDPLVIQRNGAIQVTLVRSRHEYTPPGVNQTFRVGDVHGPNILMKIEERGDRGVIFYWYNFHNGIPLSGSWRNWDFLALGDPFLGATTDQFATLARQLSPSQWERLWPDPVPQLLKMYEADRIQMGDLVVKEAYRGMVAKEARRTLDENEAHIDGLLDDPNRVQMLEEYAAKLKEASIVRDALVRRKAEIDRSLSLSQQQFHLGLPKRQLMAGLGGYQRLEALKQQAQYQETLSFWDSAFPPLSRLRTEEINSGGVLTTLLGIKASIIATRNNLVGEDGRRPTLDPWSLENVRGNLEGQLGAKTHQVVKEEDKSRGRWGWIKAGAAFAAGVALLFVPGGIFIDAAIGIAIAAKSWQEAQEIGHAANTGLHVDAGLMTQAQAAGARFNAVLATIFAALGAAVSGLRILRTTRAFLRISRTMPQVSVGARLQLARLFAKEPEVLERLAARIAEDEAVLNKIHDAFRFYGDDVFRLRQAWKAIGEGFTGAVQRAWMHGLHPDALAALSRATSKELENIYRLMRQSPEDVPDILRQFTYKARQEARDAGRVFEPPQEVGRRLTESLQNLAAARQRSYPFGFRNLEQFQNFGRQVRDALRRYGVPARDARVHGSALRKLDPGDIDVAVLVDRAEFDRLASQFIREAQSAGYTKLAKSIAKEAAKGKIPYNRFSPREPGFNFGTVVREAAGGKKVQVSLIPKGGEFDVGPYMGL